ncbi:hypothetical protein AI2968V1_0940 [Klebsiella pneumoniae]|nr:hypothetical protein AI2968V1_0940 [Klebsiella pneumoniae]
MINTRSGTRIAVSDTSIQDGVDRVYPPVLVGLEQALFFTAGGDGKNYAPDGVVLPTITGTPTQNAYSKSGNDSNLLIVFYVQIMPDDFVMQLHRF